MAPVQQAQLSPGGVLPVMRSLRALPFLLVILGLLSIACDMPASLAANSPGWKVARVRGPAQGEDFSSIMKIADTSRSDPDFAGLMIRCAPKGKIDVLAVLVRPFPPTSRPQVTITAAQNTQVFEGKMAAAGAAVQLPDEASALAGGIWQSLSSLSVTVKNADEEIKGVVALDGLRAAYGNLVSGCAQ